MPTLSCESQTERCMFFFSLAGMAASFFRGSLSRIFWYKKIQITLDLHSKLDHSWKHEDLPAHGGELNTASYYQCFGFNSFFFSAFVWTVFDNRVCNDYLSAWFFFFFINWTFSLHECCTIFQCDIYSFNNIFCSHSVSYIFLRTTNFKIDNILIRNSKIFVWLIKIYFNLSLSIKTAISNNL